MEYSFASKRSLQFIVHVGGRNIMVRFGDRNQNGTAGFLTLDPNVAQAVRRNNFFRRGIIEETTKPKSQQAQATAVKPQQQANKQNTPVAEKKDAAPKGNTTASQENPEEREYDNYTVARESICKEFGISKGTVRNPEALARVAKEHGIIIKYKEI